MKSYLISFVFSIIGLFATGQMRLSLQEAIEIGLENNSQVKQADLDMQSAEVYYKQVKTRQLPDLNASASYGANHGRSIDPFTNSFVNQNVNFSNYGANSSLLLFNGGALRNAIRENKLGYEASKMEWQQARDQVTIDIILSFLQILSAEEVLEQSKQQGIVTDEQIDRLAILNNEGAIAPAQYFDVKGQAANDQIAIADNEAAVVRAKLALAQLLNIPYERTFEVEKLSPEEFFMDYSDTPEAIYRQALESFAQVKAVELRSESAKSAIKSVRGELFPRLSLGGNIYTNYSSAASRTEFLNNSYKESNNYVTIGADKFPVMEQHANYQVSKIGYEDQLNNNLFNTVSLNLSIPIFNALQVKNRIRLARIDLQKNTVREDNTKLQLRQDIEKSYVNLTNSQRKYTLLQDQVAAFSESFHGAEIRFNAGDITSVDYLIAKNNLDRARINLILSKYDFILRKKILDYYKGSR